ncbi:GPI anchored protein, putative [Talaromyces stipitatus ATCC 10500]|uniref:GPI anchored protein, putative n=1 Tax=Talaromyces stipitatus (strain ATCC 10500 / CBS 375.48 / QM 6759 / NRRL 1006) TaxID=441959 RepID=B8MF38_TALSN|nr:GPI anchored protein, putative [Talaromyces stipitatus ATCC 10500]EED16137.1 GPI anchored protein, putative [Talaromyces stipitatus ATCC 10500]
MHSTTVAIALMSSVVAAQSAVTTLFIPGFDNQPLVASIIGGNAAATTYFIECAPGTDASDCGAGMGFTLTEGPKTAHIQMVYSALSADVQCDLNTAASEAACVETVGGAEANFPGTTSTTLSATDYASAFIPVTITAGSATGAPATTAASATAPTATATGATSGASAATTAASTAASTGKAVTSAGLSTVASSATTGSASAKSSAVSTGGMPQVTGNAQWAMGGVAVAMALAAL